MPYLLNTPDVEGNTSIRIEVFQVYAINDVVRLSIIFSRGATVGGIYTEKGDREQADLVGAQITVKMMAALSAGDTMYGAIKVALYELLREQGHIGNGAIT